MKFNRDRGDISEVKHVLGELLSFYLNTQNRRKKKLKKEKMEFWKIFRFHLFGRKKNEQFWKKRSSLWLWQTPSPSRFKNSCFESIIPLNLQLTFDFVNLCNLLRFLFFLKPSFCCLIFYPINVHLRVEICNNGWYIGV